DACGPMLYRYGRRRGLQEAAAADLVQIVLGQVSGSARRFDYDPRRGPFRGWLFCVVRHRLGGLLAGERCHRERRLPAEALADVEAEPQDPALWEREDEKQTFPPAAEQGKSQAALRSPAPFSPTPANHADPPPP